ncbi:MAG: hypothetical protein ACXU8A_10525, partial [Burkholderiaceae bacterium]
MFAKFFERKSVHCMVILMAAAMLPAHAADDKKVGKEQAKRLQQMQRQLEQEKSQKSQIEQEKTVLDGQLKDAKGKLSKIQHNADAATKRSAELAKELETAAATKAELEAKIAESEKKLAETTEVLRKAEVANHQLEASLAQRSQTLSACEAKNDGMYKYSMEILGKYESKTCSASLLQKEPFTQLKQVEIENYVENSRDKLDQQKFDQ